MVLNTSCNTFVSSVIFYLLCFSSAQAEFDTSSNKTLEKRLHSIYVNHYQRPILDSQWFKILEGIDLQTHKVQHGDTLWLISKVYFGDGHYWSKLWSVNKNITNPHLIFEGDVIYFTSGSFNKAPSIRVEKTSTVNTISSSSPEDSGSSISDDDEARGYLAKPPMEIPDRFTESYVPVRTEEAPITFIPRPKLQFNSNFNLTKEILVAPIELVGRVRSLGQSRVISAEGSIVLVSARIGLIVGELYSVVESTEQAVNDGYPLYIRAVLRATKKLDDELFEAQVVQQFDPINIGDHISPYKLKVVNADVNLKEPKEVPIRIVRDNKSVWASGDVLFFKTIEGGSVELGDVIKINNKYTHDVEFYVSNGFIKVVSVSPPFATGVVVTSREDIRKNSVSSPTFTGWPDW